MGYAHAPRSRPAHFPEHGRITFGHQIERQAWPPQLDDHDHGNLTSQHFANLYLGVIDHAVAANGWSDGYVRYMDDMLFFHDDAEVLRRAEASVQRLVEEDLNLQLKAGVTRHDHVHCGVPFLGFRIFPARRRLDGARVRRLRRRLRRPESMESIQSALAWAHQADTRAMCRSVMERHGHGEHAPTTA